jgi:hypothetical protein
VRHQCESCQREVVAILADADERQRGEFAHGNRQDAVLLTSDAR